MCIEGDSVRIGGKLRDVKWIDAKHHDCLGIIKSVVEKYKGRIELEDGQEFENGVAVTSDCGEESSTARKVMAYVVMYSYGL